MEYSSHYGIFGGKYLPEILYEVFDQLEQSFVKAQADPFFWQNYLNFLKEYSGRPTPITHAKNMSKKLGGAQIIIKREDLTHTGSHKINNVSGQALLAKAMGKKRLITETGAGQNGLAVATISAKFGFDCTVYMGKIDAQRQRPNVFWMERLGAEVIEVEQGTQTLKDAINECFRDWVNHPETTHYLLGTACGPHPFPSLVAWLQSVIGTEAKEQVLNGYQKLPKKIFACAGGGSNALGIFQAFLDDESVELIAVEAGGKGIASGQHAVRLKKNTGRIGIAQGYKTFFLQNQDGQMLDTYSLAAGLDYIGISPILANLVQSNKVRSEVATDEEALNATQLMMQEEGIIPALESAHGVAQAFKEAAQMKKEDLVLINLSGRGDKDLFNFGHQFKDEKWKNFLINTAKNL